MVESRAGGPSGLGRPSVGSGSFRGNRSTVILFLIATLIGLFAVTWSLAFHLGHQKGQKSVLAHSDATDAAAITGQVPSELPPTGSSAPATEPRPAPSGAGGAVRTPPATPEKSKPAPTLPLPAGMPPVVGADPRKPGFNYLEICQLTWRDAEPAVRFLQANGIRATAIPTESRSVDLSKPQPNNRFLLIVDQPFASGEGFRNSQSERNALMAEVRRLGKKWQAEHRGASDFQDPMWRLQRGGK